MVGQSALMRPLLGILLIISIPTQGFTQSRSQLAPPDTLLAYAGVFRMGAAHDVAIVPFHAGQTWMLLLADAQSDALRFLTPAGTDTFTTGPELASKRQKLMPLRRAAPRSSRTACGSGDWGRESARLVPRGG
jgi:hypothetical protein